MYGVVRQSGGEWASPRAARWCERCGETKSVMSKEGGGPSGCRGRRENMAFHNEVGSVVSTCFWSTAKLNLQPIIGSYMTNMLKNHAHDVCMIMN